MNAAVTVNSSPSTEPPVIFVHGTRSSAQVWERQVAALRARGIPALAIDLPGHGSRIGEIFTLEGAIAAIDDAVDSFDSAPVLVGHSLGGYATLAYAGTKTRSPDSCCRDAPRSFDRMPWRPIAEPRIT